MRGATVMAEVRPTVARHDAAVPLWRLHALRAAYLLLVVGLGIEVWPDILHHARPWELMQGVVQCVLGAVSLLALLGLRQPLRMLPLLMFELVWKSLWLGIVAVPLWAGRGMDAQTWPTAQACLMGTVFLFAVPWRYVVAHYLAPAGQ